MFIKCLRHGLESLFSSCRLQLASHVFFFVGSASCELNTFRAAFRCEETISRTVHRCRSLIIIIIQIVYFSYFIPYGEKRKLRNGTKTWPYA